MEAEGFANMVWIYLFLTNGGSVENIFSSFLAWDNTKSQQGSQAQMLLKYFVSKAFRELLQMPPPSFSHVLMTQGWHLSSLAVAVAEELIGASSLQQVRLGPCSINLYTWRKDSWQRLEIICLVNSALSFPMHLAKGIGAITHLGENFSLPTHTKGLHCLLESPFPPWYQWEHAAW